MSNTSFLPAKLLSLTDSRNQGSLPLTSLSTPGLSAPGLIAPGLFASSILVSSIFISCLLASPARAQRQYNPNYSHFYMGRQEWTVEDNSPVIINKTGTPGGGMNGPLQGRPPLPKAGWQGYAPIDNPPAHQNTPASHSGAKPHRSNPAKTGIKGHLGTLGGPSAINSYKPYATYSNPVNTPQTGVDPSASTRVKGDLLHWARRSAKPQ